MEDRKEAKVTQDMKENRNQPKQTWIPTLNKDIRGRETNTVQTHLINTVWEGETLGKLQLQNNYHWHLSLKKPRWSLGLDTICYCTAGWRMKSVLQLVQINWEVLVSVVVTGRVLSAVTWPLQRSPGSGRAFPLSFLKHSVGWLTFYGALS